MTQLIVTLEEGSFTSNIQKAIEMLKGVIGVSLYEREKEDCQRHYTTTNQRR